MQWNINHNNTKQSIFSNTKQKERLTILYNLSNKHLTEQKKKNQTS